MSAVKRQISELRDEYAALTRQRIVAAFVSSLEDETSGDVSMADIARRANVAERTIYRHFKTRTELLAAAGEWIEDNVFARRVARHLSQTVQTFRSSSASGACHRAHSRGPHHA